MKHAASRGFTIVELLIVIVVIAILATITLVTFRGVQQRAQAVTLQSDLRNAATTLRIQYAQDQHYPADAISIGLIKASPASEYQYTGGGDSFCLTATSTRVDVPPYRIASSDATVQEGVCDGHFTPSQIASGDRERNVALNAAVSSDGGSSNIARVTDGAVNQVHAYFDAGHNSKYVQIDLGQNRLVGKVTIWHYYGDTRSYNQVLTQVSSDGSNWTTVFDGAAAGPYNETAAGNVITFPAQQIRYIRDTMNGNTRNQANHWTEIRASYR